MWEELANLTEHLHQWGQKKKTLKRRSPVDILPTVPDRQPLEAETNFRESFDDGATYRAGVDSEAAPLWPFLSSFKYARSNLYLLFHTSSFITLHYLVMNGSTLFLQSPFFMQIHM